MENSQIFRELFNFRIFFEQLGGKKDEGQLQDDQNDEAQFNSLEWDESLQKMALISELLVQLPSPLSMDELIKKSRLGMAIWNAALRLTSFQQVNNPEYLKSRLLTIEGELREMACFLMKDSVEKSEDENEYLEFIRYLDSTAQSWLAQGNLVKVGRLMLQAEQMFEHVGKYWSNPSNAMKVVRKAIRISLNCTKAQCEAMEENGDIRRVESMILKAKNQIIHFPTEKLSQVIETIFLTCRNIALTFYSSKKFQESNRFMQIGEEIISDQWLKESTEKHGQIASYFRFWATVLFEMHDYKGSEQMIMKAIKFESTEAGSLFLIKLEAKQGGPSAELEAKMSEFFQLWKAFPTRLNALDVAFSHPTAQPVLIRMIEELQKSASLSNENWLELQLRKLKLMVPQNTMDSVSVNQLFVVDEVIQKMGPHIEDIPGHIYRGFISWIHLTASEQFAQKMYLSAAHWCSKLLQFLRPGDIDERASILIFLARIFLDAHQAEAAQNSGQDRSSLACPSESSSGVEKRAIATATSEGESEGGRLDEGESQQINQPSTLLLDALQACQEASELMPASITNKYLTYLVQLALGDEQAACQELGEIMEKSRSGDRAEYLSLFEACAFDANQRHCQRALIQSWKNVLIILCKDVHREVRYSLHILWNILSTLAEPARFETDQLRDIIDVLVEGEKMLNGRQEEIELDGEAADYLVDIIHLTWNAALLSTKQASLDCAARLFDLIVDFARLCPRGLETDLEETKSMSALLSAMCSGEQLIKRQQRNGDDESDNQMLLSELANKIEQCQALFSTAQGSKESTTHSYIARSQPLLITVRCSLYVLQGRDDKVLELVSGLEFNAAIPHRLFPVLVGIVKATHGKDDLIGKIYEVATQAGIRYLQSNLNPYPDAEGLDPSHVPPVIDYIIEQIRLIPEEANLLHLFEQALMVLERFRPCQQILFRPDQLQWLMVKAYNIGVSIFKKAPHSVLISQQLKKSQHWVSLAQRLLKDSIYQPIYDGIFQSMNQKITTQLSNL